MSEPKEPDYKGAYHFICGYIMAAQKISIETDLKLMLQATIDIYNLSPTNSVIEELGLKT